MTTDFVVTREAVEAGFPWHDRPDWALLAMPCPLSVLLHISTTAAGVGYCLRLLRLDRTDGVHNRLVRFSLGCAQRAAAQTRDYPDIPDYSEIGAGINLVEAWLRGDTVTPDQFRLARAAVAAVPARRSVTEAIQRAVGAALASAAEPDTAATSALEASWAALAAASRYRNKALERKEVAATRKSLQALYGKAPP